MSNHRPQRPVKMARRARRFGVTVFLAATVAGYAIYRQSVHSEGLVSTPTPTSISPVATAQRSATTKIASVYHDGDYVGDSVRAQRWGMVQVKATIANGSLNNVVIVSSPQSTPLSVRISQIVLPYLTQEAIQSQSASVDLISGATATSEAFTESLQSALDSARNSA